MIRWVRGLGAAWRRGWQAGALPTPAQEVDAVTALEELDDVVRHGTAVDVYLAVESSIGDRLAGDRRRLDAAIGLLVAAGIRADEVVRTLEHAGAHPDSDGLIDAADALNHYRAARRLLDAHRARLDSR